MPWGCIFWVCLCSLGYPACTISSVACPALKYLYTLSHKRHNFRKEKLLNVKFVFWFSLQLSSETFPILRIIGKYKIKNMDRSSCKVPVIFTKTTNKMQMCRIIYCSLTALHVSSDIFAHHQEHLNCNYSFRFYSRVSWSISSYSTMTAADHDTRE